MNESRYNPIAGRWSRQQEPKHTDERRGAFSPTPYDQLWRAS